MLVVCKEKPNEYYSFIALTKDRKYEVFEVEINSDGDTFYYLIDDNGNEGPFLSTRFKPLSEVRIKKLDKINGKRTR